MSEDGEKQFDPTEQKLRKAREDGDVPRSAELNSALMYVGFWLATAFAAGWAVPRWLRMAARAIGAEPWPDAAGHSVMDLSTALAGFAALATVGFILAMGVPVLAGLIVQRAITFSPKKLNLDFGRINPLKNAKQKFGTSGLVTYGISVGKVALMVVGGWFLYRFLLSWLMTAEAMDDLQWVDGLGDILRRATMLATAVAAAFAIIDLLWKRIEHRRRLRMSRKEMQDEFKESEGDPHLKAARRQKGVDLVLNSMLADVEKADVIIVNPTHYAVALEWKRGSGRAPVCLAKGMDEIAARIREKARENGVPIWSDPPCARAIYASVELGDEIETEQFAAVAAAIRFAEEMRKKARNGWGSAVATKKGKR
ncbi:flagellar type III secretion system protein FlhB [Paracoccus sulfuroxidans]|uniref:Flagellar biosynthetic protein FlhB n=1 Tax=Paracoccus sulfuroxidans TaxID=384678 RepID=A0A562N7J6_9RHOB|nr:flagellar type III secretion system protein FlhB [Paracoccus sulfuroxidans]TWI28058.1 flagellar biosynthetic protein FlhB [Paracoccus sulfuroxidans]